MLNVARLAADTLEGAGSFNPKKDGPLIEVLSSEREAGGVGCGGSTDVRGGTASGRGLVDPEPTLTGWGLLATGAGASNVVPHIPQNRFCSGFSLPQRGQRTDPPDPIAYDILAFRCRSRTGTCLKEPRKI